MKNLFFGDYKNAQQYGWCEDAINKSVCYVWDVLWISCEKIFTELPKSYSLLALACSTVFNCVHLTIYGYIMNFQE